MSTKEGSSTASTSKKQDKANGDLQLVPETVLRNRHTLDDLIRKRAAQIRGNNKVFSASKRRLKVIKPETILAQAIQKRNHGIRYQRVLIKGMQKRASNKPIVKQKRANQLVPNHKNQHDEGEEEEEVLSFQANSVGAPMVFVIRMRNNAGMPREVRNVLNKLHLRRPLEGTFVRYNPKNRRLLHCIEPFILYGSPSRTVVADLIQRRGHARILKDGRPERVPLASNTLVEESVLGQSHDLICLEDVVHELVTAGKAFDAVCNFLWNFELSPLKTKFETGKLNHKLGHIYGDKGQEIDYYIQQML